MELPDPDSPSASTIISLLLEDLTALDLNSTKDPAGIEEMDDADSYDCIIRELEDAQQTLTDRTMAQSISQATDSDRRLIRKHLREERQVQRDHWLAVELDKTDGKGTVGVMGFGSLIDSDDFTSDGDTGPSGSHASDDSSSESEAEDPLVNVPASVPREPCISCLTDLPPDSLLYADCDHAYCRGCMRNLFRASFRDESLFPPRCCRKPLPITHNRFIGRRLGAEYAEKDREFSTPAAQRTYCYRSSCGAFIPHPPIAVARGTGVRASVLDIVSCEQCARRTCVHCKNKEHMGSDCQEDKATLAVREMGQEMGWQECRQCHRMIELDVGCNHITCRCSHEFCYVCGARWKTCQCPQWDEDRLLRRAGEVVDRRPQPQGGAGNLANRVLAVANMQRILRNHHECDHEQWQWIAGRHRCDQCRDWLREYIFECTQCRITSCRRCRYNRA
ncbi:hypothetical protein BROUX41_002385 [Berkeleyomyces rouxiae]|uniref:uncharacterized protein n=1 Tax=Berkeleyomyces rouxiae TaxID=2035830 RepID=UPI003B7AABBF